VNQNISMIRKLGAGVLGMALGAWACQAQAQVGADLNISPKRVVFAEGERSATVYVFNQGDTPATYTVEMVDRVMLSDGRIAAVSEQPGATVASASPFVQYTPRRVTLGPKESQSIRVRVRVPDSAGEFRTHLTVTALPPETVGFTASQAVSPGANDVALQVVALFSVSIPVIVRQGEVDVRAAVENPKPVPVQEGLPHGGLSVDLVRLGASSVYGDIEVRAGQGKDERVLTAVRGVAVYAELPRRTVIVPLAAPLKRGEALRIVYRDDDIRPGTELAAASFVAP